jgi:DNA-binding LytR/AlgR family response regulator
MVHHATALRHGIGTNCHHFVTSGEPAVAESGRQTPRLHAMADSTDWFARYQPVRRRAEAAFWVAVLALQAGFNTLVQRMDRPTLALWQPLVWEVSSAIALGLLVPAVVAWERRFPLRWGVLRRHLAWHLAATVVFCVVHVAGMVALRKAAYAALGQPYEVGSWAGMLAYEYLKDVRTYAMILAAALSYRLLMLRLQGEARVLDAPEPPAGAAALPAEPPARPERFLVRKLRREFLVAAADIECLQAQGNYVGLRVNGHDYLLRATLTEFLEQLDPARFVRVHRSHAVNLDRVAEIEPLDSGDARVTMRDGSVVPVSRRYRDALRR